MSNFKLFFKYVFFKINYSFVNNLAQRSKNTNLCINNNALFFSCTHMKMSTSFYSTQLCDMFAYEILSSVAGKTTNNQDSVSSNSFKYSNANQSQSTIVVYNFHSLHSQNRFFIFTQNISSAVKSKVLSKNDSIDSIAELFPAANWLEREIAELHGISFFGKKDLRNLMLQYGDSTAPFQKSFPSIGIKELFYSPIKDTLVQNHISVQL
jgi:NADH:ubiquinone oxidoreductase subunit C